MSTPQGPDSQHTVYGAVLAGGQSIRMGADKRFLNLNGEFLVDRAVRILRSALKTSGHCVYLCGDVPNRDCIPDSKPTLGPLGGVESAIKRVRVSSASAWLLIIPVDMPRLSCDLISRLIVCIPETAGDWVRAVAYEGFEMPLLLRCDSFTENCVTKILQSASPSAHSIRALMKAVGLRQVPFDCASDESMLNANSPHDWSKVSNEGGR